MKKIILLGVLFASQLMASDVVDQAREKPILSEFTDDELIAHFKAKAQEPPLIGMPDFREDYAAYAKLLEQKRQKAAKSK